MTGNGNEPSGTLIKVGVEYVKCPRCDGTGLTKTGKSRCGKCRGKKRILAEVAEVTPVAKKRG